MVPVDSVNFDNPVVKKHLAVIDELALISARAYLRGGVAAHRASRERLNRTSDALGAL